MKAYVLVAVYSPNAALPDDCVGVLPVFMNQDNCIVDGPWLTMKWTGTYRDSDPRRLATDLADYVEVAGAGNGPLRRELLRLTRALNVEFDTKIDPLDLE